MPGEPIGAMELFAEPAPVELALRRIETLVHALRGTLNATQPVTDDGTL